MFETYNSASVIGLGHILGAVNNIFYNFSCSFFHIFPIIQWDHDREGLRNQGSAIVQALSQMDDTRSKTDSSVPSKSLLKKGYAMLASSYDSDLGGFGKAPKFPQPGKIVVCRITNFMF